MKSGSGEERNGKDQEGQQKHPRKEKLDWREVLLSFTAKNSPTTMLCTTPAEDDSSISDMSINIHVVANSN